MAVLSLLSLALTLLDGVATAFNKGGLADLASGVQAAIAQLQKVQGQAVTQSELEGLRATPQW